MSNLKESKDIEDFDKIFLTLWFQYLKHQLDFVAKMKDLHQVVEENLKRVLDYLITHSNILGWQEEKRNTMIKSQEAIKGFFPALIQNYNE